jgi:hypothetical protein
MANKEFCSLFPEFRYEVFEEKIEKPLELNLHANSDVSMNALNTIGWHGPPPGRATRWCGPLVRPLTSPFRL